MTRSIAASVRCERCGAELHTPDAVPVARGWLIAIGPCPNCDDKKPAPATSAGGAAVAPGSRPRGGNGR